MRSLLTAGLLLALAPVGFAAGESDAPRIVRVQRDVSGFDNPSAGRRLVPNAVPKLTDELSEEPRDDNAVFYVYWNPPAGGLPAGAVLHFDYRQERVPGVRTLSIKYPFSVSSSRKATFEVAPKAYHRGGEITAWRVRLVYDDRVVAKLVSPAWK